METNDIQEITDEEIVVEADLELDAKAEALRQHNSIIKMGEERDNKIASAREQLVETLGITAEKYITANGVMAGLETLRQVVGENSDLDLVTQLEIASEVAKNMSQVSLAMMDRAETIEVEDFGKLCEDFYTADFTAESPNAQAMTQELMLLQLCQNVGPSAEDILGFKERAEEEIQKATDKLAAFLEENELKAEDIF